MKRLAALTILLLGGLFAGCGQDRPGSGETVGTFAQCKERVDRLLTANYLRDEHEIASVSALDRKVEIVTTCTDLPPGFELDQAVWLTGSELHRKIREGEL